MKINVKHLLEAYQAMQAFSRAMMPHAIDSMGTDKSFYNLYREHADRMAHAGAYLKISADIAIKDVELEIEHD
jgi:hypothetical protein